MCSLMWSALEKIPCSTEKNMYLFIVWVECFVMTVKPIGLMVSFKSFKSSISLFSFCWNDWSVGDSGVHVIIMLQLICGYLPRSVWFMKLSMPMFCVDYLACNILLRDWSLKDMKLRLYLFWLVLAWHLLHPVWQILYQLVSKSHFFVRSFFLSFCSKVVSVLYGEECSLEAAKSWLLYNNSIW